MKQYDVAAETVLDEIFEYLAVRKDCSMDFSFTSEDDMDNNEAMRVFLEDHDLLENVAEDLGKMVFLDHDEYNFQVVVESEGQGDFYSHGIYVFVNDGDKR